MAKKKVIKKPAVKKTVKAKVSKEEPVYGLVEETKVDMSSYIIKVMKHLGYDLKRAAGYRYYTKSSRPVKANFKEKELEELFKND